MMRKPPARGQGGDSMSGTCGVAGPKSCATGGCAIGAGTRAATAWRAFERFHECCAKAIGIRDDGVERGSGVNVTRIGS